MTQHADPTWNPDARAQPPRARGAEARGRRLGAVMPITALAEVMGVSEADLEGAEPWTVGPEVGDE